MCSLIIIKWSLETNDSLENLILTNSPGSLSRKTCFRYVTLFGVDRYIFCEATTHVSITMSGRSENKRMQSLKHELSKVVLSCCKIDIPMKSGYELSPSSNLSHKWMILWSGNTSAAKKYFNSRINFDFPCVSYVRTLSKTTGLQIIPEWSCKFYEKINILKINIC